MKVLHAHGFDDRRDYIYGIIRRIIEGLKALSASSKNWSDKMIKSSGDACTEKGRRNQIQKFLEEGRRNQILRFLEEGRRNQILKCLEESRCSQILKFLKEGRRNQILPPTGC